MERMNERECEDKREREDENANGDAGLDALVSGTNVPQGTVVLAATPIGNTADASARLIALLERADIVQPKTPAVSMRSPTVSVCM